MIYSEIKTICRYKNVNIVHIVNPRETLSCDLKLKNKVLSECDMVQKSVWAPRQSIEENTINNELLILLEDKGNYVGFTSVKYLECGEHKIAYWHDAMISCAYHGQGFSRLMALLLTIDVFNSLSISNYHLMTATSNSRIITTLYTKHNIFKEISIPVIGELHRHLLKIAGGTLFAGSDVDIETGIIKGMWLPQDNNAQHVSNARNISALLGDRIVPATGDALAVISRIDEESIINASSMLRGVLNVENVEINV